MIHKIFGSRRSKFYVDGSNASNLQYFDYIFDFVFNFGGINYFQYKKLELRKINRVTRGRTQICICVDGFSPWLNGTDCGKRTMLIENGAFKPLINEIPDTAISVFLRVVVESIPILCHEKDLAVLNVYLDV